MSVFVDKNATFDIIVRFKPVLNETNNIPISVRIIKDNEEKQESEQILVCQAVGRSFEEFSLILEDVTLINHITGKPMIRTREFRYKIIENFITSWNIKNEDNSMVPIAREQASRMHYSLIKAITDKWLNITRG